jgi:hypothetical protein
MRDHPRNQNSGQKRDWASRMVALINKIVPAALGLHRQAERPGLNGRGKDRRCDDANQGGGPDHRIDTRLIRRKSKQMAGSEGLEPPTLRFEA